MNRYLTHLLTLYKNKQLSQETALSLIEEYKAHHQTQQAGGKTQKIAIIGLSARMPMADNAGAFWDNLAAGKNCVRSFPDSRRRDIDPLLDDIPADQFTNGHRYWKGGFIDEVDKFDNEFFEILPAEAKVMDPHQRIFLELASEAFQDAGYTREQLRGSNTGVFLGDVMNEYHKIIPHATVSAVVGNVTPFITSRVSYFYDLNGPTLNINTTCSTSLVAIHAACQAILNNECELALAGAINLRLFPFALKDDPADALGITTDDGFCRAFDNDANGIVRGEGGGAFVLKPYDRAVEDRDHIYAVILGSAVNNDGRSSGVGAPNPLAHEKLMKKAWERCGIDPRTIQYIEGHGTGTKIGDPIEVNGITRAFSNFTQDKQFCGLGSVKTNIGHLTGGASGFSGLLKTVLAIKHKEIPPTLHFNTPNELINFAETSVYITDALMPWPAADHARRAAVNAFGFNGTNCHMVIEEGVEAPSIDAHVGECIFVVSHRTEHGLRQYATSLLCYLQKNGQLLSLSNVCYTLAVGREQYKMRCAVVASSIEDLLLKLQRLLALESVAGQVITGEDIALNALAHRSVADKVLWKEHYKGQHYKISLPTYCFEKKRFWIEGAKYGIDLKKITANGDKACKSSEAQLLDVVTQVMGLDSISLEDNFFDLGGDSLLGIQLINEIHKFSNKKISYQDLFSSKRLQDLLDLLKDKDVQVFHEIQKLPPRDSYMLSFGQRRLWILHQMQDNPIAYNMYEAYELLSEVNVDHFRKALDALILRHSAFHFVFSCENGIAVQKQSRSETFDFDFIDLSAQCGAESKAKDAIDAFKLRPFDLEKGPLARALMLKVSPQRHIFFFVMHHIISDGWSMRLIVQDLLRAYQTFNHGASAYVPVHPKIEYQDYAHWQHQTLSNERFKQLEDYWIGKFSGPHSVCEIIGDRPRPPVFTFEGARKSFVLPAETVEKFTLVAQQHKATLFMSLLTAVYIFIYRYTGQQDVIVGTPVSGRSHIDLKNIVGFFVNTLTLRSQICPSDTFQQLLSVVRDDVLEAFEHQDYPFDYLVDKLKLERDTSRSPLFNINVALQNFELDEMSKSVMREQNAQRYELEHHSCKWDLEFEFVKQADGSILGFLEYYRGIYSDEMIGVMMDNFISLLQSITSNPSSNIDALSMKHEAINLQHMDGIDIGENGPLNLHNAFERQVVENPEAPAVKFGKASLSYRVLNERANRIAHFLRSVNEPTSGKLIGILMSNSVEAIIAILGILKAGCAYVPMDTKAPLGRLKTIVQEGGIELIITVADQLSVVNALQWSTKNLKSYLCLDVEDVYSLIEPRQSSLMDPALWNHVVQEATDEITASGWVSSYTGLPFTEMEMDEYSDNVLNKLRPFLTTQVNVLELGCGSGLTAFAIAPHVNAYTGTDLSSEIIARNAARAQKVGCDNLRFHECFADQIDHLEENFDLIIMNSVIHCFSGLNYLRSVIAKALDRCSDKAVIFLGDLMDQDLKETLERSFVEFKQNHAGHGWRTKTDWSRELFVSRAFLEDLQMDFPMIKEVSFSRKIHTIENELTLFRYDAFLIIDKSNTSSTKERNKHQYGASVLPGFPQENLQHNASPIDLAYVIFTSGSTGVPKGVMVEHQTVYRYCMWAQKAYQHDTRQVPCYPFYSSLTFDLTVTSVFCPLLTGSYLRVFQGEFDSVLLEIAKFNDCNILKLTPTHLLMMLEMQQPLPSIRTFVLGGEALYSKTVNALHDLYHQPVHVYNEYGPTEATVGCIVYENAQRIYHDSQVPIGRPMSHVKVHILNEGTHPTPIGGIGEICVGGSCLARGYLNNEPLTKEKFIDDPFTPGEGIYRTGDLGRCLTDGVIEYHGRSDRQVKVKGYRIELNEIESKLYRHPSLCAAAVAVKNDARGDVICAYYTTQQNVEISDFKEFLQDELPAYMIPGYFIHMEKIPHSPSGKVDYLCLPDPLVVKGGGGRIAPTNAYEDVLAGVWSAALGISKGELSVDDDFFNLGGDSIIAMRILPKVKAMGWKLSIKDIFQLRTISALSQHIARQFNQGGVDQHQHDTAEGEIALTPIQHWFFEQKMAHPEYFNMSYMFKINANVNEELLEEAIARCIKHHDILRACFDRGVSGIKQRYCPQDEMSFGLVKALLDGADAHKVAEDLNLLCLKLQNSFDLSRAPLLKAALIDLGSGEKRLLMVIHHLIIDGVSWRYLVEDIETLYRSKLMEPLPAKTLSFKGWSESLQHAAAKSELDLSYWSGINPRNIVDDVEITGSSFLMRNYREDALILDTTTTRMLFEKASRVFSVNDILLSALQLALFDQWEGDELLIDHEGHGRDGIEGVDVSRTLGWFTTIYPVHLQRKLSIEDTLKHVSQSLKRLSHVDINYGIGRFLKDPSKLTALRPLILFNYFGRLGADLLNNELSLLKDCEQLPTPTSHQDNCVPHALEINAIATEEHLRISWMYDTLSYNDSTISELIASMEKHTLRILESLCK